MKNCLIKKKKLFDGGQELLVNGVWQIACCACGQRMNFGISDCKSMMHLDPEVKERVLIDIKNIELKSLGDTTFYKVEGLPLHFVKLKCPSCDVTNLGILGVGEYQPARYMVVLVGLMVLG